MIAPDCMGNNVDDAKQLTENGNCNYLQTGVTNNLEPRFNVYTSQYLNDNYRNK